MLASGRVALYLAPAGEHAIVEIPKAGGGRRALAHVDGTVRAMAWADDALWVATSGDPGREHAGAVVLVPTQVDGGGAPRVVASGLGEPRSVASDGRWGFVVVVNVEGATAGLVHATRVERVSAQGGATQVVGRSEGDVTNLALDDDRVYWADPLEGTLVATPKAGGATSVLAEERGIPGAVAVLGESLFWTEKRSETMWAMPKRGGAPRQVAQDFAGFAHLVAGAGALWWVNETAFEGGYRVLRSTPDGADATPVTETVDGIDDLATDGLRVFWAHGGRVGPVGQGGAAGHDP